LIALRPRRTEQVIEGLVRIAGLSAIVLVALIFAFLLKESLPLREDVPLAAFFDRRWYPIEGMFGFLPLIYGSLLVTVIALVIAVPLGLATAIYLGQMATDWLRDILKPMIEILAGIPSIVLGFLGWVALAPLVQNAGAPTGLSAFTGGLVLAYMALPTIISIAEDAIDAVPKAYKEGALALGATQWQTTYRVTLPAARSGIVTAIMLGVGRSARPWRFSW
jgi:phosphate transport system permease protein